jgi:hypothetical protein
LKKGNLQLRKSDRRRWGRLQVAIYDTWTIRDDVLIRQGVCSTAIRSVRAAASPNIRSSFS